MSPGWRGPCVTRGTQQGGGSAVLWFCIGKALQTHCWDGVGGQCFLPRDHTRTDLSHCGMMPSRGWAVLFSPKSPWGVGCIPGTTAGFGASHHLLWLGWFGQGLSPACWCSCPLKKAQEPPVCSRRQIKPPVCFQAFNCPLAKCTPQNGWPLSWRSCENLLGSCARKANKQTRPGAGFQHTRASGSKPRAPALLIRASSIAHRWENLGM